MRNNYKIQNHQNLLLLFSLTLTLISLCLSILNNSILNNGMLGIGVLLTGYCIMKSNKGDLLKKMKK